MIINKETHFKIIIPMFNCEKLAISCIDSVLVQRYKNWRAIICIEPSDDSTFEVVSKYLLEKNDKRVLLVKNSIRKHVPKNHIDCIKLSNPNNEDVIVLLDGDDRFYEADVLDHLNSVYRDDSIWITWGSYIFDHDHNKKGGASTPNAIKDSTNRRLWGFSHLKTFRYFLWRGIKDEDMRELQTGNYYTVAGDMAIMFPMVEMAGRAHSKYIDKILYIYNQSTPFNDEKIYYSKCKICSTEIRNRTRYKEKTKEELLLCKGIL